MKYTELHLHTHYSLLDGLNTPEEYMRKAKEIGMTHLAVTDHGTPAAHREFQKYAKEAGITPILGLEAYISPTDRFDRRSVKKRDDNTQAYNHIGLLAMNENGLTNLYKLSEIAWTEGFYSKPRIDFDVLEEHNEDLVVLSGCLNGLIAKAIANGDRAQAENWAREFQRVFGERFFIEVQSHNPKEIDAGLRAVAEKYGIRKVITSDCHHAWKEDIWREDAMLILSTKPKVAKDFSFTKSQKMDMLERLNYLYPDRTMTFAKFELFLHSAEEHFAKYGDEEAINNTQIVADMIGDYPYHEGLDLLPKPKTDDPDELLRKKAYAGLKRRGLDKDATAVARLEEELEIIVGKNFSVYFLVVANTIAWAKSQGIFVGPGRGSAAGSLVCYALEITNVNPLEHNLLFFRFINPERNDFPDIDTDFEDSRRNEIKDYMLRKYKHVASIATYGTYSGKNCVKDAARVFQVPIKEVNKAIKGANFPANMEFFEHWLPMPNAKDFKKKYPEVVEFAQFLQGRIRQSGMHAGGLVVSNRPINEVAPMQTAKDTHDAAGPRIPLVAYDMETIADIGLIKLDYLGVSALTVISNTLKLIKDRTSKDIDLEQLTFDDPAVFQLISSGHTKGIFQSEGFAYTNLLYKMDGVKNFNELVASNALVRPGAMDSTAGAQFLARSRGRQPVQYYHDDMKWFTEETYGTIIYQEQVMLAMTELAGMKMSTADKVRKIIGKKRDVSEFEQYREEFINGASQKVSQAVAEQLWHDFEAHANYSFNKSHAVAYSMVSYWTAWLKTHYPLEFMVSLLAKEKDNDKKLEYLMETKRLGIRVLLPHVNKSDLGYTLEETPKGPAIRIGLSNIKGIKEKTGGALMKYRPYENYAALIERMNETGSGISTAVVGSLNAVGAAVFPDNPKRGNERDNLFEYLAIPAFQIKDLDPLIKAQFRPLDDYNETDAFVCMGMARKITTGPGWARVEVVDETGVAGIFAEENTPMEKGSMYVMLVSGNSIMRYITTDELLGGEGGPFRRFLEATSFPDIPEGMLRVVSFKTRMTKKGQKMANVVFCDADKNLVPALVFPSMWHRAYGKFRDGAVVDVQIEYTQDDGTPFVKNVL